MSIPALAIVIYVVGSILNLLIIAFGIAYLVVNDGQIIRDVPYMQAWCIVQIILFALGFISSIYKIYYVYKNGKDVDKKSSLLQTYIAILPMIGLIIWGWVIYADLYDEMMSTHIWIWFKIILIFDTIFVGLAVCCSPCLIYNECKER